jgi:hypothetical protein
MAAADDYSLIAVSTARLQPYTAAAIKTTTTRRPTPVLKLRLTYLKACFILPSQETFLGGSPGRGHGRIPYMPPMGGETIKRGSLFKKNSDPEPIDRATKAGIGAVFSLSFGSRKI